MTDLLSPGEYDDDASLRSPSEQDSDPEDDEFLRRSRTTLELAEHDRTVLDEEDELEKLLTRSGPTHGLRRIFSPVSAGSGSVRIGKRERRRRRQERREARRREQKSDEGELMYEMEDGEGEGDELLRRGSYEEEKVYYDEPRVSWTRYALVFTVILVLFLIIVLGAYKASSSFRASRYHPPLLSNGTTLFAPTTILISLDGFRADFLHRGLTPALSAFIAQGVSPQYMTPSFPSVTFPNHFTLVTGLYPESHGVVGNSFYDPALDEEFYYTDSANSMRPQWWNAEPIWNTLEEQDVRSAIHMWPGSEAHIGGMDPEIVDKFNKSEDLDRKTDRVLELLDQDDDERPQLIAAYVPNVDADGHKFGPNSTEVLSTIVEVDAMLGDLFAGLEARNLTDVVNVVIVSDHGMATTATERLVQLEDLIDLDLVDHIDGWPSRGLRPKNPEAEKILEEQLLSAAPNYSHAVEIYTRETMPERYHFSNNDRIAPLWVIPRTGWAIVERPEMDARKALETGEIYSPKGIHGYDHEHPLMRAIFLARGPAFPHPANSRLDDFQNVNVYNILCDSLGIEPLPNNGTLRLPLQPIGLHSDEDVPVLEHPLDPPIASTSPSAFTSAIPQATPSATDAPVNAPANTTDTEDDVEDEDQPAWWKAFWGKMHYFKDWAEDMVGAVKDNFAHGD
ncbi:hypothetical protein SI65_02241 [Aspergillus cristatus]|uniref:Pyrophosphatase/phosphodiesterase n=1 Tax=Aspergillus cristatus TaxID=573508 RepID=A0A1E3BKG1_ASPCR|nr:hypothetical protein SI65_02241 [Aspergillus cristatus]